MRYLASLVAALLLASPVYGQTTGIFQSYIVTSQNGSFGSGTSYGTSGNPNPAAPNPGLNGASGALGTTAGTAVNLGTYNIFFNTLTLNGQVLTFKNGSGNVTGAFLNYRVYETGGTPGGFSSLALGFSNNRTFFDIGGVGYRNAADGGVDNGDQLWANAAPINLIAVSGFNIAQVSVNYTLEVFFSAATSNGIQFNNNNGGNFFATFTVVPEPSTYLAGGLLVGVVAWRLRRRSTQTVTAVA